MASLNGSIITEDFTDINKLLFPITPWQIITDGTRKKLVNNTIGNSTNTSVSFVIKCSHLEIDYMVSSESGCDYFSIWVDGVSKVNTAGNTATTSSTFSIDLTYGNHTIMFKYLKDSSAIKGNDRGEVWGIRYTTQIGTPKYLIADDTNVKTVPNGTTDLSTLTSLTTLGTYPMSDTAYFTNNGMDMNTVNYIITNKKNLITSATPKILLCTDWLPSCIIPNYKVLESSNPYGQIGEMKNDITFDVSTGISNINKCAFSVKLDDNALLKFIFSKDSGNTWLTFDGTNWVTCNKTVSDITSNGLTIDACNNLTEAQLTLISDTRKIRVAWVMKRVGTSNAKVQSIGFKYS